MYRVSFRELRIRRRGLTLMELVVVLAILVALAGIITPLLPGLIGRAETSSRATNSGEIAKAIMIYEAGLTRFPTDWDALTDGTAAASYVNGFTGATPVLAVTALTATQASALTGAGINRIQKFDPAVVGTNRTFNPYPTGQTSASLGDKAADGIAIAANANVVTLTVEGQRQLNFVDNTGSTSSGTYVVFGIGKRCSLVGSGALEAPTNFFDNAALSPDSRYERYGVVFQVAGVPPNNPGGAQIDFARAKFVRVFRFGGTVGTGDDAIKSYWDDVTTAGGS